MKIWGLERALFFRYRPCSLMVAGRWESSLDSFYNGTNPVHQGSTFKNCFIFQRAHLPVLSHRCSEFQPKVCGRDTINFSQWRFFWGGALMMDLFLSPQSTVTPGTSQSSLSCPFTHWCDVLDMATYASLQTTRSILKYGNMSFSCMPSFSFQQTVPVSPKGWVCSVLSAAVLDEAPSSLVPDSHLLVSVLPTLLNQSDHFSSQRKMQS